VFAISKWLEAETQAFNLTFRRKDPGTPLVEFLGVAARQGTAIYARALHEVTRQVPICLAR